MVRPSVACWLVLVLGLAARRMRLGAPRSLARRVVGVVGWGEGHSHVVVGRRVADRMEAVVKEHGSRQAVVEGERHSSVAAGAGSGLAGEAREEHRREVEGMEAAGSPVEEERLAEGREEAGRMRRREVLEATVVSDVHVHVRVPRTSRMRSLTVWRGILIRHG